MSIEPRPAIPAELRRRILVEAVHRCAIHTCQHPTTDLHHIVPWERCREHTSEYIRKSLDLRSWEAASDLVRGWEEEYGRHDSSGPDGI